MSGGGTTQQTQQTTQIQLPRWVNEASQGNYQLAEQIGKTPYNAAASEVHVAGAPTDATAAYDLMRGNVGATQPAYNTAMGATQGLLGYTPDQVGQHGVTAAQVGGMNLQPYLNPITDQVVDRSLSDLDLQRQRALTQNASDASMAKSFGGGRHGVTEALTNEAALKTSGDLSANLRSKAYDMAMQLAQGDANRKLSADTTSAGNFLTADTANQAAKAQGAGIVGNAAGQLGALAGAKDRANLQDYSGLLDSASKQQGQTQAEMDAARQNAGAEYQDKVDKLNLRLASLGMSPYGRTETTNGTKTTESSTDWASLALGGMKLAAAFAPSDRRLKTNIAQIGSVNGLPLYSYQYLWGTHAIGFMADEVAQVFPEAVGEFGGGYSGVDYGHPGLEF